MLTWRKAKVQKPGSRGGRGYYDARGEWRYGDRPMSEVRPADGSLAVQLRSQKEIRFRGREVKGPADVAAAFRAMTDLDRERLWTVALDGQRQVMAIECVAIGGMDFALADPREIVKSPVALGASALYVIHNHPSGDPSPSMEDRIALDRVRGVGRHLGLEVMGMVVGRRGWSEIARTLHDGMEPQTPYHESGGRFAPPEVAAIRKTSFGVGATINEPDALLEAMRGLYDPDARSLIAVGLDTRLHIVTTAGMGMGLEAPTPAHVTSFLRAMLLNGARSVALVCGRNGEEWSGADGASGLVEVWLARLGGAARAMRMPTIDCLVVGPHGYTSLRESETFRAVQVEQTPLMWKAAIGGARAGATRSLRFLKGRLAPPAEPAGKIPLGKTRAGRPVFASGAESAEYSDDDHQDAAVLHATASAHHEQQAAHHRAAAATDDDWRRGEQHHQAAERHDALALHHFRTVREHLVAGGRGGDAQLAVGKDGVVATTVTPHSRRRRREAAKGLGTRTHHDHPGGVTDADKAAYAKFAPSIPAESEGDERAARPVAKGQVTRFHEAFGVCEACQKPMFLTRQDRDTLMCPACGNTRPTRWARRRFTPLGGATGG